MGGFGDAAEFGSPRTHRRRVPRPAQPSRIPDDPGGENRFTPQRGRGPSGISTTTMMPTGPRSYLNLSGALVVFMSGEVVGAANGLVPSYDGHNEGTTC